MRLIPNMFLIAFLAAGGISLRTYPACAAGKGSCEGVANDGLVELNTPSARFVLDTRDGLRAECLENRQTGRKFFLGKGPEVRLEIADRDNKPKTVELQVTRLPTPTTSGTPMAEFELSELRPGISATVAYELDADSPVFRKKVEVFNHGDHTVRLLDVYLGEYVTDGTVTGREQVFPGYLDDQVFMTLVHPAGWAKAEDNKMSLCQHPGAKLAPGQSFQCMEVVYGVAPEHGARKAFLSHLQSRMRRVVRGHDKPYAIFEPFGARPDGNFNETELSVHSSVRGYQTQLSDLLHSFHIQQRDYLNPLVFERRELNILEFDIFRAEHHLLYG